MQIKKCGRNFLTFLFTMVVATTILLEAGAASGTNQAKKRQVKASTPSSAPTDQSLVKTESQPETENNENDINPAFYGEGELEDRTNDMTPYEMGEGE